MRSWRPGHGRIVPGVHQESAAFWLLCLNETKFCWTHRYGRTPEHTREYSGTQTWKTKNQTRIVLRINLILKWEPPSVNRVIQMTQTETRLSTWWQEFKKRFPTASLELPQENKRKRAPHFSHKFAVRRPCDKWSRSDSVNLSAVGEQQQLRQHQQQHH